MGEEAGVVWLPGQGWQCAFLGEGHEGTGSVTGGDRMHVTTLPVPGEHIWMGPTQLSSFFPDMSPVSRCVFYFTPTFERLTQFFFFSPLETEGNLASSQANKQNSSLIFLSL